MDLYPWIVFLHVTAILLFFIAHGTSMAVGFQLRRERDPARIRALLDLSSWTLGVWPSVAFIVGLLAGITVGIVGGWFGQAWIWISLALLVLVSGAMTPLWPRASTPCARLPELGRSTRSAESHPSRRQFRMKPSSNGSWRRGIPGRPRPWASVASSSSCG